MTWLWQIARESLLPRASRRITLVALVSAWLAAPFDQLHAGTIAPETASTIAQIQSGLELAKPDAVRLNAARIRIGLTTDERNALALTCAREPIPDDCVEYLGRMQEDSTVASVGSFWLDRTETTVEGYSNCMRVGRCPDVADAGLLVANGATLPVAFVDRDAARAYCNFHGGRLPTRLEFERAARGRQSRLFPWGNLYNSMASNHGRFGVNHLDPSDGATERDSVGSQPIGSTPEGILDLAGNVAEWVEPDAVPTGDAIIGSNTPAVACGGSFATGSVGLVGGACISTSPRTRRMEIGFRCAYDEPAN